MKLLERARLRLTYWFAARLPVTDHVTLTQRSVYIVPTRAGLMLGVTLLVLLLASINYQLSLGYLLTFLLAGCNGVAMHVGHATLRGLTMNIIATSACYARTDSLFDVQLLNHRNTPRHAISLAVAGTGRWVDTDVAARASASVRLAWRAPRRGLHRLPTLQARTVFPLGTFRVWTVWRPAAQVLVYPQPEAAAPALPLGDADSDAAQTCQRRDEPDSVRAYRAGDSRKHIVWKKVAQTGALVSRDSVAQAQHTLWLDRAATGLRDPEHQLSRLCAWVLQADAQGRRYGLRLATGDIPPDSGAAQRQRCLHALALA